MRDRLSSLLGRLGLSRYPDKGQWEPVQRLEHLDMEFDSRSGRALFLFLAIKPARFIYMSELHEVLLHEDNMDMVHDLPNLTARSPMLMTELQKLWFILDSNDISIRARYIKTTASIWADCLSREIHYGDGAVGLRHFNHLENIWGRHTIDRFATMENSRLPRYNSR
eukprot:jgi/Tetstr1/423237/TSEL_001355.t1